MIGEFDPSSLYAHQSAMLERMSNEQRAAWGKLSDEEKIEIMALHTGMAPEGDRPLLRRPEPEYISSREMLDVLLRKSAWAPIDEGISLDYAIQEDPETMHFEDWIKDDLKKGFLRPYAKVDGSRFQEAMIDDPTSPDVFIALVKGARVHCHVRRVVGDNYLFPNLGPMDPAECELWFVRTDVDRCPLKAFVKGVAPTTKFGQARVDIVATAKCGDEPGLDEASAAPTTAISAASPESVGDNVTRPASANAANSKKRDRSTGNPNGRPTSHDDIKARAKQELENWIGKVKDDFDAHMQTLFPGRISIDVMKKQTRSFWQAREYERKENENERIRASGMGRNVHRMRTKA